MLNRRNFVFSLVGGLVALPLIAQAQSEATHLGMVTVHTNETLPIEFAPETHGVSVPAHFGDGKRIVYVAPHKDLERLSNPFGVKP